MSEIPSENTIPSPSVSSISSPTSTSPASFTYPFAAAPDIIRSNQKDAYYQGIFLDKLSTILRNVYGARVLHKYSLEAKTVAELIYLGLTTLRNSRTLGEEYCDILQVEDGQRSPSLNRRTGFIMTTVLFPYIIAKSLPKIRARLRRKLTPRPGDPVKPLTMLESFKAYILAHLDTITSFENLLAVHLGIFYFTGAYYHLSKRVWGLRYIFTKRLLPHEQRQGYEVLGVLLLAQLSVQTYSHLSSTFSNSSAILPEEDSVSLRPSGEHKDPLHNTPTRQDAPEINLENPNEMKFLDGEVMRKCTLCLEMMKDPTATSCGHIFCWNCISEWCRNKPECPLCRQISLVQHLLPLRTY